MTTRETIEQLYANGLRPCEIIRRTGLAEVTVYKHLRRIRRGEPDPVGRKRGAGNRRQSWMMAAMRELALRTRGEA
jgi:transposase